MSSRSGGPRAGVTAVPVADQFADVSAEVLSILDRQLAVFAKAAVAAEASPSGDARGGAPVPRDRVLFFKMKADTHRYLAELAPPDAGQRADSRFPADRIVEADCALSAYKLASGLAREHLRACDPLRLMLALNFSTFYADVRHSLRMACHVAKHAYEAACEMVHTLSGEPYNDAVRVLQLIRDNISAWSLTLAVDPGGGGGRGERRASFEGYSDDDESDVDVVEDWEDEDEMEGAGTNDIMPGMVILGARRPESAVSAAAAAGGGGAGAGVDTAGSIDEIVNRPLGMVTGMKPSLSAPVLKGHGGRALRRGSFDGGRPDSAPRSRGGPADAATGDRPRSPSRESRKSRLQHMEEAAIPPDHLESLMRGVESVPLALLEDESAGGSLSQALFEIFHSYLEGKTGTPVATQLADGSSDSLAAAIRQANEGPGLRLSTDAMVRMLRDFGVVPKLLNEATARDLANHAALANTVGTEGPKATVVLVYSAKYNLNSNAGSRRKRPRPLALLVKDHTSPPPGGSSGRGARHCRKDNTPVTDWVDFSEFVDLLGRVAIIVYKMNPGGIEGAPRDLANKPAAMIGAFFRHQMLLYSERTLLEDAAWRKLVKRPWEHQMEQRRITSPKAMMRPPLPGEPRLINDRAALLQEKLEMSGKNPQYRRAPDVGRSVPDNKDPRKPQFALTESARRQLWDRRWTRSLKQIFDFYRKINTIIKKQKNISSGTGGGLFEEIEEMNNIITLADFIKFLADFRVCPHVLKRDLVQDIFLTATRKVAAAEAEKKKEAERKKRAEEEKRRHHGRRGRRRPSTAGSRDGDENHRGGAGRGGRGRPSSAPRGRGAGKKTDSDAGWALMGATWETFVDCVGRCAIAADFQEPERYIGDVAKVIGFFVFLELDEGGWRNKMKAFGSPSSSSRIRRSAGGAPGSMTGHARPAGFQRTASASSLSGPSARRGSAATLARGAGLRAVRSQAELSKGRKHLLAKMQ